MYFAVVTTFVCVVLLLILHVHYDVRVVMWEKKDDEPKNQLWYDDFETCTIRSAQNDLCLTVKGDVTAFFTRTTSIIFLKSFCSVHY